MDVWMTVIGGLVALMLLALAVQGYQAERHADQYWEAYAESLRHPSVDWPEDDHA